MAHTTPPDPSKLMGLGLGLQLGLGLGKGQGLGLHAGAGASPGAEAGQGHHVADNAWAHLLKRPGSRATRGTGPSMTREGWV